MEQEEKTTLTASETEEAPEIEAANDSEEQLPPNVVEQKGKPWLPYVITFAVLTALTLLVAWAEGGYRSAASWLMLGYWGSSIAVSGVFGVSFGILVWASNGGAFDIFAYGGRTFVRMFRKKDILDRKYRTYYDYRQSRKKKKRNFWFVAIVGSAFLAVGIVLIVVGNQLMPK